MKNEIADKLARRRNESHDLNQVAEPALGLGHYDADYRYHPPDAAKQQSLVAVFGRAAFDKAVTDVKIRAASQALACALTDPGVETGNLAVICRGEFMYSLKQLFPGLRPKERVEVKADLEKKGFIFDGEKLASFAGRP